jgi:hypothetical protein
METGVHLTDVPTQSEAEVVCGAASLRQKENASGCTGG